jgi:hypothetical protein
MGQNRSSWGIGAKEISRRRSESGCSIWFSMESSWWSQFGADYVDCETGDYKEQGVDQLREQEPH